MMVSDLCDLIRENNSETTLAIAIKWALKNVDEWMRKCTDAWKEENPSALSGPFSKVISWHNIRDYNSSFELVNHIKGEDYQTSWDEWNQSSTRKGILFYSMDDSRKRKHEVKEDEAEIKELHLWRSYGTISNYVCPGGSKRSSINDIVSSLSKFSKINNPPTPFNSLFIAEPGWGKSYLAKCLSDYFDFDYLSYSVAQMGSTKELIDSFKEISSTQKRSRKKILVFMDEREKRF